MTSSEKSSHVWIPLAVAGLAILVYLNSLGNDFVWDDTELIVNNPSVHNLSALPEFFQSHFWSQSNQPSARGYFRPLILLSYAFDYAIWGPNPLGFHITNVLWHVLASVMVCLLVMRLTSSQTAAMLTGVIFAVHPVHVESVAFISGRTDVIATALSLISIHLFIDKRDGPWMIPRMLFSLVLFALAVFAKEIALVVPVLLLLGEMIEPSQDNKRGRFTIHLLFWVVLGLHLLMRFGMLKIVPQVQGRLTSAEWLYTMPVVVLDYARLLVAPIHLCADYAVKVRETMNPLSVVALILLLVACGAVGSLIGRKKLTGFFAAWILLGLLPVLQVIPISVLQAERFLYMPSVGFCALAGLLGAAIYERVGGSRKKIVAALFAVIILALSIRTTIRNTAWKDEFTLYKTTASSAPGNFRVQYNLGNAYFREGDVERAIRHTEIAFRLRSDFPQVSYNLGVMYAATGREREAESMYRHAIDLNPGYALAHNNLAVILYTQGRFEEARTEWSKALSLMPDLVSAREGLRLLDKNP